MPADRVIRILSRLASAGGTGEAARLCAVSAEVTEMSGAGIMLLAQNQPLGSVCTTNAVSTTIEELQYTLGEGPCIDAHRHNTPVLEPDLARPHTARWAQFSSAAVEAGARAVFGFPVTVGDIRLGALNLYRDRPGPLTDDQHADALAVAGIAARAIIAMQAPAAPGDLGPELETSSDFRFVVHQAAGMVSVQLGVTVDDALLRLRARAYSTGVSVSHLAAEVTARRLRFDPAGDA